MKKSPVEKHFDLVAVSYDFGKDKYSYYYNSLKKLLGSLIPKGQSVVEIGCGTGDLLASLNPRVGYGMDVSPKMVEIAKTKYKLGKNLFFSTKFPKESFDYIFMSDVVEHLDKPEETFRKIIRLMNKDTVFINTMANPIWEPLLMFWEKMGWKMPEGPHNRIKYEELKIMLEKAGMKIIKHDYRLLIPVKIPWVTEFANQHLEKYLKRLAFIEYITAIKS